MSFGILKRLMISMCAQTEGKTTSKQKHFSCFRNNQLISTAVDIALRVIASLNSLRRKPKREKTH